MDKFGVVLFPTSTSAMQAEAVLSRAGLPVKLIPTPRELSSDCGVSLRFDWEQCEKVSTLLIHSHVEIDGIHPLIAR